MATGPTAARFPAIPERAGHYESWYLKLAKPDERLAAWIRYTVDKRPGAAPDGSLWFTLFDASAAAPQAWKVTFPSPATGDGSWLRVGDSLIGDGEASGRAGDAAWSLRFESHEPPLWHLPHEWMYTARLPRTKTLTPLPAAHFEGHIALPDRELRVDGWRGVVGHNWGAEHAERWIWLHGAGFAGTSDDTWLDAVLGRIKFGPIVTPWMCFGTLSLEGVRHRLGGFRRVRSTKVRESPERCEYVLPGADLIVEGVVSAPRKDFVGWVYADPAGGEHHTVNCSIADMNLSVQGAGAPVVLRSSGQCAYELGTRERDHGVPIQPDGA